MRKLSSGCAVTGGVLNIFGSLMAFVILLSYNAMSVTVLDRIIGLLNLPALILLTVILFRRRPDTFAAVVCFFQILPAALNAVSICLRLSNYRGGDLLIWADATFLIGNLAKIALFTLMGLRCVRRETGKSTPVLWATVATVALAVIGGAINSVASQVSGSSMGAAAVLILAAGAIGAVIGALPQLFVGLAFVNIRTEALYPSYGQYPPQYPQYQQPQYPQQYQAPQYQAPQYQAPQYQAPQYQAPQYQAPQYQAPQYQPQYQAPQAPAQEQPQEQ